MNSADLGRPRKNLIPGAVYGAWILSNPLECRGAGKNPSYWVKAACKLCADIKWCAFANLVSGRSKQCRVCADRARRNQPEYTTGSEKSYLLKALKAYQRGARKFKRVWELTDEEAFRHFTSPCFYCGLSATPGAVAKSSRLSRSAVADVDYIGIDRVDSRKGYTLSNTLPCCKICNQAKNSLTLDQFFAWMRRAGNYSGVLESAPPEGLSCAIDASGRKSCE